MAGATAGSASRLAGRPASGTDPKWCASSGAVASVAATVIAHRRRRQPRRAGSAAAAAAARRASDGSAPEGAPTRGPGDRGEGSCHPGSAAARGFQASVAAAASSSAYQRDAGREAAIAAIAGGAHDARALERRARRRRAGRRARSARGAPGPRARPGARAAPAAAARAPRAASRSGRSPPAGERGRRRASPRASPRRSPRPGRAPCREQGGLGRGRPAATAPLARPRMPIEHPGDAAAATPGACARSSSELARDARLGSYRRSPSRRARVALTSPRIGRAIASACPTSTPRRQACPSRDTAISSRLPRSRPAATASLRGRAEGARAGPRHEMARAVPGHRLASRTRAAGAVDRRQPGLANGSTVERPAAAASDASGARGRPRGRVHRRHGRDQAGSGAAESTEPERAAHPPRRGRVLGLRSWLERVAQRREALLADALHLASSASEPKPPCASRYSTIRLASVGPMPSTSSSCSGVAARRGCICPAGAPTPAPAPPAPRRHHDLLAVLDTRGQIHPGHVRAPERPAARVECGGDARVRGHADEARPPHRAGNVHERSAPAGAAGAPPAPPSLAGPAGRRRRPPNSRVAANTAERRRHQPDDDRRAGASVPCADRRSSREVAPGVDEGDGARDELSEIVEAREALRLLGSPSTDATSAPRGPWRQLHHRADGAGVALEPPPPRRPAGSSPSRPPRGSSPRPAAVPEEHALDVPVHHDTSPEPAHSYIPAQCGGIRAQHSHRLGRRLRVWTPARRPALPARPSAGSPRAPSHAPRSRAGRASTGGREAPARRDGPASYEEAGVRRTLPRAHRHFLPSVRARLEHQRPARADRHPATNGGGGANTRP